MIGLEFIVGAFGLTYKNVAEKIGISPKTLNDWVKGRSKIPQKRAKQLSGIFGLQPEVFQKELNNAEKLKIQIKYLELTNQERIKLSICMVDDSEDKSIDSYAENTEAIRLLQDKLVVEKVSEKFLKELKEFISENTDLAKGKFLSKEQQATYTMIMFERLLWILKTEDTRMIEAINNILCYYTTLYFFDQKEWEFINPNASADSFLTEFDRLIKTTILEGD